MPRLFRIALLLLFTPALSASSQTWSDPTTWATVPKPVETKDIVYFPKDAPGYTPTSQLLDVYQNATLPPGKSAPVLIYMHGGAWRNGQRPASYGSLPVSPSSMSSIASSTPFQPP
jgi:acetyl esterase/lipase